MRTAQSLFMQLARKECNQTTRVHCAVARLGMASFKCIVDKGGTQYSLIPLMECKEALTTSLSVINIRSKG